jgi:hypothetical protein
MGPEDAKSGPGRCRGGESRWTDAAQRAGACVKMKEPGPGPFGAVDDSVGEGWKRGRRRGRTGEDGMDGLDGQDGGGDGVKRARADSGTSGSEGREAAAALTKKEATVGRIG